MKTLKVLFSILILLGLTYGLLLFFRGYEIVEENQLQSAFKEQDPERNEVVKNEVEENHTFPTENFSPVENEVIGEIENQITEVSLDESYLEEQINLSTGKTNFKLQEQMLVDLDEDGKVEYVGLAVDLNDSCFVICVFDSKGELVNFLEKVEEHLISGESEIPNISLTERIEVRYNQEYARNEIYVFSKGNAYLYQINDYFWFSVNENWQVMHVEDGIVY